MYKGQVINDEWIDTTKIPMVCATDITFESKR